MNSIDYLYLKDVSSNILIDSIRVDNGEFFYELELLTPKLFRIHNKRDKYQVRDSKMLWLEPGEITISGDCQFIGNMIIKGCKSQIEYSMYNDILDSLTRQIILLKEEKIQEDDWGKKIQIERKIDSVKRVYPQQIIKFLKKNINSYVTLSTLFSESYYAKRHLSKSEIYAIYEMLPDYLKKTKKGAQIVKFIELPQVPKIGDKAIEIAQLSPIGDTIKLSDFRGKYVLIDFWASWCSPCRGANKRLNKIYKKYNSKGFEILSVSGDNNRQQWINAINDDSIDWPQISDLKGWHNEAFLLYDIKSIPRSFLISPEGIILGERYCSMTLLEKELSELLN